MDNLKALRQKVKDYSNFKKEKKFYEDEQKKQMEQEEFEDYKGRRYGIEVKGGGFIAKGCGKVMNDRRKVTKMY